MRNFYQQRSCEHVCACSLKLNAVTMPVKMPRTSRNLTCSVLHCRGLVTEMICMICGKKQPVSGTCAECKESMARYYCSICRLFDDDPSHSIYHCQFCNVCRRGEGLGIDFFHCMECNACMHMSLFNQHTCREKSIESNCPICNEGLFDSCQPIKVKMLHILMLSINCGE